MLVVETVARIRREHFVKGKTIKEIARDLGVSRNTVRKVLRSGETSFEYERNVQPRPKLGRWTAALDELLEGNAAKPAREQLTLIRIFEDLRGRGYDGGYDALRRYAKRWAKQHGRATAAAYVPLSFAPGEAYQFDWSHEVVLLNGVTVIVKVAHVRLCHSRMLFVRAYPRETQEMVFDAHDRAFALFKGTCGRGIYDNMKTAVETVFVGTGDPGIAESPACRDVWRQAHSRRRGEAGLKTKNFHWHMSGPHFRDYHLLLDEQGDQIFATTDAIAERVRKIGGTTLHSIGHIGRLQRVQDNDSDFVTPMDMLAELRDDNKQLVANLRETHGLCDEHDDVATASLLEIWIDEAERRTWFLFEATRRAEP